MLKKPEARNNIPLNEEVDTQRVDEKIIWSNFKRGDSDAYLFIYNRYAPLLFRYGRKIIRNREIVKDCIHDLFVILWKNRETLGNPPSIKNYLFKSLRGKLFRALKNKHNACDFNICEEYNREVVLSKEFDIINDEMATDQKNLILKALNSLTTRQREIIHLLFYNDFTAEEVASTLSITKRTVYNTVYAALQVIKKDVILNKILFAVTITVLTAFVMLF